MNRISPKRVRYIKLGKKDAWAERAFERGEIYFGAHGISHDACIADDWDAVALEFKKITSSKQGLSQGLRQIKDFYDQIETLWVTMTNGRLWWCLSNGPAHGYNYNSEQEPSHRLTTISGWSSKNVSDQPLVLNNISSALTKTAAYQRTICSIEATDYLLRLINDEHDPLQLEALATQSQQIEITRRMIERLHWSEFETLVDLIFSRNGWQRTSVLGRNLPDVDLIAEQPLTGSKAWVQVKTSSDQSELDTYFQKFKLDGSCSDFFYACHTSNIALALPKSPNSHLWQGETLAQQALSAGLFNWLIDQI